MTFNIMRCLIVLTACLVVFANSLSDNSSTHGPYVYGHYTRADIENTRRNIWNINSTGTKPPEEDDVTKDDDKQKRGLWADLVSSIKYGWNNLVNDPIFNEKTVTDKGEHSDKELTEKVNLTPAKNTMSKVGGGTDESPKFDLKKEIAEAKKEVDSLKVLSQVAATDENKLIKQVAKENPGAILDGLVDVLKFGPLTKKQLDKYKITLSSLLNKNVEPVSSEVIRIKLIRKEIINRSDDLIDKIKDKLPNSEVENIKTALKKLVEDNGLLKNILNTTKDEAK